MKTITTLMTWALFAAAAHAAPIEVKTSISALQIDEGPEMFREWALTDYKKQEKGKLVDLDFLTRASSAGIVLAFDDAQYAYLTSVKGAVRETAPGTVEWSYEDERVRLVRTFVSRADVPYVDATLTARFRSPPPKQAFFVLSGGSVGTDEEEQDRKLEYFEGTKLHSETHEDDASILEGAGKADWIAVTSRYFVLAAVARGGEPKALVQHIGGKRGRVSLVYPVSEGAVSIPLRLYAGPKALALLKETEPKLDRALDLGFFSLIAYPLLRLLQWFHSFVHNYGIAIILLTLVVRVLMYPLVVKSMRSMKAMAKLQPEMQRIREKYANDKQGQNVAMMTLLRTNKYNPMAGCFPILIQIPVFFALYKVLYSAVELYQAPFAFWIHDLSAKDPFYVTPVLLSLVMFWQQKISPNTVADPMQRKLLLYMPLIFGVFMISLPSGLTLYMLVSGIFGVIQQMILNRQFERNA